MTVETTLSALADDTRRGTVEALGRGPLTAGQLAARLDITPAALTGHLRVLRRAKLVAVALDPEDTRRHVYSIEQAPFDELGEWVRATTDFWTNQLGSFVAHSKGTTGAKR
ncbi:MAG: ArsR/SmtB family transcription factor [Acidimicrobiia bacterium]